MSTSSSPNQAPVKFPTPKLFNAQIFASEIINENGAPELKNILSSASGQFYEFMLVAKKSIFGLVVRANVLKLASEGLYERTGIQVAIKVASKESLHNNSKGSLEDPLVEIAAMQDLGGPRHPNLAHQYECCVDEKNIYSVLHFHTGMELFDYVLNYGAMEEVPARFMFRQLIRALARLDQRLIGHRDVSIENIMYNAEDHSTALIDFGLCAKLRFDHNEKKVVPISNIVCGKGHYMAPEATWSSEHLNDDLIGSLPTVREGELVNPLEGDIWSAGLCLLYVLLGFPPIEIANRDDIRYNMIVAGRLPELILHWEVDLSDEVVDLLHGILKENPAERLTLEQIWAHPWMMTSDVDPSRNPAATAKVCTGLYLGNPNEPLAPPTRPSLSKEVVMTTKQPVVEEEKECMMSEPTTPHGTISVGSYMKEACDPENEMSSSSLTSASRCDSQETLLVMTHGPTILMPLQLPSKVRTTRMDEDTEEDDRIGYCVSDLSPPSTMSCRTTVCATPDAAFGVSSMTETPKTRCQSFDNLNNIRDNVVHNRVNTVPSTNKFVSLKLPSNQYEYSEEQSESGSGACTVVNTPHFLESNQTLLQSLQDKLHMETDSQNNDNSGQSTPLFPPFVIPKSSSTQSMNDQSQFNNSNNPFQLQQPVVRNYHSQASSSQATPTSSSHKPTKKFAYHTRSRSKGGIGEHHHH